MFSRGDFVLAGGARSNFKILCDDLTEDDWATVASLVYRLLPMRFQEVEGVPTGGFAFAEALKRFRSPRGTLLIADDVLTTGKSMKAHRNGRMAIGVVLFARGTCPSWVTPVFELNPKLRRRGL